MNNFIPSLFEEEVVTCPDSVRQIESIKVSGAPFPQRNDCTILSPEHSCAIAVTFKPTALGPRNGVLEIYSNDPDEKIVRLNLLGTGK